MLRFGLAKKLDRIVGREALLDRAEDLGRYQLGIGKSTPKMVCLPNTAQQISQILQAAAESKTPVVTQVSEGTPKQELPGSFIYLDLRHFNKIVKIGSENLRAVVQPAVTLTALREALAPREIDTSVLDTRATTIGTIRGLHNAVTRLEVVLPNGRIANLSAHSTAGYCLMELFLESQSTLGIVTEITLELNRLKAPEYRKSSLPLQDCPSEVDLLTRVQHALNQHSFLNPHNICRQA